MNAYAYQAALWCEECIACIKHQLKRDHVCDNGDSDTYPQGPFANGGGEADCPQHCDCCNVFLKNPLTNFGIAYVRDALADKDFAPQVLAEWRDYYDYIEA